MHPFHSRASINPEPKKLSETRFKKERYKHIVPKPHSHETDKMQDIIVV